MAYKPKFECSLCGMDLTTDAGQAAVLSVHRETCKSAIPGAPREQYWRSQTITTEPWKRDSRMCEQKSAPEIPEDLRHIYENASPSNKWHRRRVRTLIERIATLTAERDAAREQLVMAHEEMATVNQLIVENAALKQQVARLDWQPITPENLPKVGDEIFTRRGEAHTVSPEAEGGIWENCADGSWTHFRPINPPAAQ